MFGGRIAIESFVVCARVKEPMSWRMSRGLSVVGLDLSVRPEERRERLWLISVRREVVDASSDFVTVMIVGLVGIGNS